MGTTQLLATFCNKTDLDAVIVEIQQTYELAADRIYLLENLDDHTQVIITYNIQEAEFTPTVLTRVVASTISVHRKKQTNTIYTINALNKLILEKNNGVLDTQYKIDWEELNNMILVTAYNKLKKIPTKILEIRHLTN